MNTQARGYTPADTQRQPVQTRQVQPAIEQDDRELKPTEIRYGWCPFGDINLMGADGTSALYVQPHVIDNGQGTVTNEYHYMLPKGQLIPFPTFVAIEPVMQSNGQSGAVSTTRTITALEASGMVYKNYSAWGFTVCRSLQGIDQDTAFRIFQVVHPLNYPLGNLINEMSFGARERIDAYEPITFKDVPDYAVEPLRSDLERSIALKLANELEDGAQRAFDAATEILDNTKMSMTTRFAGGQGKTGPDPLDRRLSEDMGTELPKLVNTNETQSELANKIDFLVDREASRADKEEIARLKAELAAMQTATPIVEVSTCGATTAAGGECGTATRPGDRCRHHKEDGV